MKCVFLIAACTSVLAVFLICAFLFANGIPAIGKIGPLKFLLGTKWKPSNNIFGILPMIVASIYVTAGAILLGVPIALFTSVFMARYCPKKIYRPLKSGIELMAGVPSIVYGFFGLVLIVPLIRQTFGGTGTSMLAASSVSRNLRSAVCRRAIMRVRLHWEQPKKEVFSVLCFRQRNQVFLQLSYWESAVRSEKQWRLSWLQEISRECHRES